VCLSHRSAICVLIRVKQPGEKDGLKGQARKCNLGEKERTGNGTHHRSRLKPGHEGKERIGRYDRHVPKQIQARQNRKKGEGDNKLL
jgi:hypothetical protein